MQIQQGCPSLVTALKRVLPIAAPALLLMVSCSTGGYYGNSWRSGWLHTGNDRVKIVRTAERFIGVRYRSGGVTPRGFDCSGYVMYVYRQNGVLLPRTVKSQFLAGRRIGSGRLRPGDLVFFNTSKRNRFSHVGIFVGENRFIHAPRTGKSVSYAEISKPYWKKRFIGAVTFMRGSVI